MDIKEYLGHWDSLKNEAKFSRITILALSFVILLLSFFVLSKDSIVTIVPYSLYEDAMITSDKGSQQYKEAWGYLFATEIGNITQKDYDFVKKRLDPVIAPNIKTQFFKDLETELFMLVEDQSTMTFAPVLVMYEKATDKVFVFGRATNTNSLGYQTTSPRTYEMRFIMSNYAPQMVMFTSYEGEPRDRAVLKRMRKMEQAAANKAQAKKEKEFR